MENTNSKLPEKNDKPKEANTASQTRWETSGRQGQKQEKDKPGETNTAFQTRLGGRSIPDEMGDKLGDKRKTRPARRTQHPSQGRHTKKALRTPTVNCLFSNRQRATAAKTGA